MVHSARHVELSDLIGKKFAYGGRGPEEYDCYGLAVEVCRRAGVYLPDHHLSCRTDSENALSIASAADSGQFVRLAGPQPFCIVTLKPKPPFVSHIGVVIADCESFIHTGVRTQVCIEKLNSPFWNKKIEGFYLWKN